MPRRSPLGLPPGRLLPVAALALAAGCSIGQQTTDGATVKPVDGLSASTLLTCGDLKGLLPQDLADGIAQRTTVPLSDTTVAWGTDPAIDLRCGVKSGNPLDDDYTFNGVHWAMHDNGATNTWTTLGRKVNVAVIIPDKYDDQAEILGTMAKAINSALK